MLALSPDEGLFVLDTDASNVAMGVVLSHVQDGEERVIAYYSRLYAQTEVNYCTSRKELLAVVKVLRQFRPYVLSRMSERGPSLQPCRIYAGVQIGPLYRPTGPRSNRRRPK